MDIHETLLDIIDNRMGKSRPEGRGISLFTPISTSRSCFHAWIPKNFCLCQYNATEEDKSSKRISFRSSIITAMFTVVNPSFSSDYHHSLTALLSPLRDFLLSYPCLNIDTLHCNINYSLHHPHQVQSQLCLSYPSNFSPFEWV